MNPGKWVGFEQITVDNTVKQLDLTVCDKQPRYAICIVESDVTGIATRHLATGDNPTTTIGSPRTDGAVFDLISTQDLVRFKITEAQAGTTILNVEYYE